MANPPKWGQAAQLTDGVFANPADPADALPDGAAWVSWGDFAEQRQGLYVEITVDLEDTYQITGAMLHTAAQDTGYSAWGEKVSGRFS